MSEQEVQYVQEALHAVLQNDNQARQQAEDKLKEIRTGDPDKYASCIMQIAASSHTPVEIRSLALVVFRRNISSIINDEKDIAESQCIWKLIRPESRELIQQATLQLVASMTEKILMHKVCNFAVELAGTLNDIESQVWNNLLQLAHQMVQSGDDFKIEAALHIFNGLFSFIVEDLYEHIGSFRDIFASALLHQNNEIALAALQATSNLIQVAEPEQQKPLADLLEPMTKLMLRFLEQDEETHLEDALIEFNEMAEVEPKYFKRHYKDLVTALSPIALKSDFTNATLRHQPVEFFTTVAERIPAVLRKKQNQDTLMALLDLVFKIMIDIDEDVDESWMAPKEGFRAEEEEESEDSVHFGKGIIDKLVSCVGEGTTLPLLSQLVLNTVNQEQDWRFKHAGLMAFSQVGEYIEDISTIQPMIPIVTRHLTHKNPKVRYAALHCIGQIADDMGEEFVENFHSQVMPALVTILSDQVPRVQAHCCAALTNFLENTSEDIAALYSDALLRKLLEIVQNGISLIKENGVTAIASLAEALKEKFQPHFEGTLQFMSPFLQGFNEPIYKQLKGQVIEALTIICAAVGAEFFKPYAEQVVNIMLEIQNQRLDDKKDPQRTYLLSAWQRMCLLLKKDFVVFLPRVIPSLFALATLNPETGVQGFLTSASITDVLQEASTNIDSTTKININTDETEEKDVAIQMLAVFIDELEGGFADYIEPTSKILLSLVDYALNDSIRTSVAGSFPGLVKCAKDARPDDKATLVAMGKTYLEALVNALNQEQETEARVAQIQAIKDVIDEVGDGFFFDPEQVNTLAKLGLDQVEESDKRIEENNNMMKKQDGDDEDDFDEDDEKLVKEENKGEYELQLSVAELIGILFKTHAQLCGPLIDGLFAKTLRETVSSPIKQKKKFALFILDDMVEFLGQGIGAKFSDVSQALLAFAVSPSPALRQASVYGIGLMAQNCGPLFASVSGGALQQLKTAIEIEKPAKDAVGKNKEKQWRHARDNAISALGKIIRYQSQSIDTNAVVPSWVQLMPIVTDQEEAKIQGDIFADLLSSGPELVLGANKERLNHCVSIIAELLSPKLSTDESRQKLVRLVQGMSSDAVLGPAFQAAYNKLSQEAKSRMEKACQ